MDEREKHELVKDHNDVETAGEIAPGMYEGKRTKEEGHADENETGTSKVFGWIALALSVAAFFFAPILTGAAGIVFAVLAKRKGIDTLGNIALVLSILAIVISLFTAPYV